MFLSQIINITASKSPNSHKIYSAEMKNAGDLDEIATYVKRGEV